MVCSHRCSAEEGTSVSLLPETAEEVWNEPQNPQVLLHLHCGEHPDRLHHRLVWKQHRWLGVDRYVFFRADTDTDYYRSSRPITDILNRYTCLV